MFCTLFIFPKTLLWKRKSNFWLKWLQTIPSTCLKESNITCCTLKLCCIMQAECGVRTSLHNEWNTRRTLATNIQVGQHLEFLAQVNFKICWKSSRRDCNGAFPPQRTSCARLRSSHFYDLAFPPQIVPARRRSTLPQCSRKHDDCDEVVLSKVWPGLRYHVFSKCKHLVHHMLQIKHSV